MSKLMNACLHSWLKLDVAKSALYGLWYTQIQSAAVFPYDTYIHHSDNDACDQICNEQSIECRREPMQTCLHSLRKHDVAEDKLHEVLGEHADAVSSSAPTWHMYQLLTLVQVLRLLQVWCDDPRLCGVPTKLTWLQECLHRSQSGCGLKAGFGARSSQ